MGSLIVGNIPHLAIGTGIDIDMSKVWVLPLERSGFEFELGHLFCDFGQVPYLF